MPLGKPLIDTLDRMGYGGLILGASGQVLRINQTAKHLLTEHSNAGPSSSDQDWSGSAFRALLKSNGSSRFTLHEDAWIVIRSASGHKRPLVVRSIPIEEGATAGPFSVVILIDLAILPQPKPDPLRKIFGLTPSEARLAIEMALGKSPEQIAEAAQVSIGTVRRQLSSVFDKTGTRRQPELVALLAHVSILP